MTNNNTKAEHKARFFHVLFVLLIGGIGANTFTSCSGDDGDDGRPGDPGVSCIATQITGGVSIACGDSNPIEIKNGTQGSQGIQGIPGTSCTATSLEDDTGVSIKCGEDDPVVILNGEKGEKGDTGGTPECKNGTWHVGTVDTEVSCVNGATGPAGPAGPAGPVGPPGAAGSCEIDDSNPAYVLITCGANEVEIPKPGTASTEKGSFTYAGQTYKTVKIGNQVWMAENLNYDGGDGSLGDCYGATSEDKEENCEKYGRLYDWDDANEACPENWHLPTHAEWSMLYAAVGGSNVAGIHLKAKEGWRDCGDLASGELNLCEDTYGFAALPGGDGNSGSFFNAGNYGFWWSATENGAYYRDMDYSYENANWDISGKSSLFSVRCVKDED